MKLLVRQTPDNFIKTVNDEIGTILNRHFGSIYPEFDEEMEKMDKLMMPLELTEKKDEYDVKAELPGVNKEDLEISLEKNYLTIKAQKHENKKEDDKHYKTSEFKYGEFTRSVYLPQEVEEDKIEAKMENGVLQIRIPKMFKKENAVIKITVK